jgi:hypothetical protein
MIESLSTPVGIAREKIVEAPGVESGMSEGRVGSFGVRMFPGQGRWADPRITIFLFHLKARGDRQC